MTDRVSAFHVVLERDIREDDAREIIAAIRQLRGVLHVQAVKDIQVDVLVATSRIKHEVINKLITILERDGA